LHFTGTRGRKGTGKLRNEKKRNENKIQKLQSPFFKYWKPQKSNIININQEGHIFNASRIMFKESFICLGGVANKRLALAQAKPKENYY
jgi:hypothetical protein